MNWQLKCPLIFLCHFVKFIMACFLNQNFFYFYQELLLGGVGMGETLLHIFSQTKSLKALENFTGRGGPARMTG